MRSYPSSPCQEGSCCKLRQYPELWAERRQAQRETRAALLALGKQLEALTSTTLSEVGYHQHRGQWRRWRQPAG